MSDKVSLKKYYYYSRTAKRDTPVNVYLPANYDANKKYPVLYILHGYWDTEDWMTQPDVGLESSLSAMPVTGIAKEMIVVIPYIYCSDKWEKCNGMNIENSLCYDNFINDMFLDLIPFIEENFSVAEGRENRAITGFSMGGRESLYIGIKKADYFGYVGACAPAPGLLPGKDLVAHPGQFKDESELVFDPKPYVLMISAGETDGVVGGFPDMYKNILNKNGQNCIWHFIKDGYHNPTSVRPHLYEFMKAIFKVE